MRCRIGVRFEKDVDTDANIFFVESKIWARKEWAYEAFGNHYVEDMFPFTQKMKQGEVRRYWVWLELHPFYDPYTGEYYDTCVVLKYKRC